MQRLIKLKKLLKNGILSTFTEAFRAQKNQDGKFRALTAEEIDVLKKNGNHSENWNLIKVEQNFTPERVRGSIFIGEVRLPAFYGTLLLPGDVSFPTGIYDSIIHNCDIENALIYKVSMLSKIFVSRGAVLYNVGTLVSSGKLQFLKCLNVGNECGGRSVKVFPEITYDLLEFQISKQANKEILNEFSQILNETGKEFQGTFGFVGSGAVVSNTNIIRNSWIGPHARLEGVAKIRNSIILSSLEETTGIYDSVILEDVLIQESVRVYSAAQIKESLICRKTKIGKKALIHSSVISPCVHIEEAEVTNSFVGPLTQMHHHALLIAAVWLSGGGNLGYGANVGSNHTGKKPDQEIHPGAGMFFGLGVNVKFPANFKEAPFSIIASGVTTLPERLRMPFSLICSGNPQKYALPIGYNEIIPAWNFQKNFYALMRNSYKYSARAKGEIPLNALEIFSLQNALLAQNALFKLEDLPIGEFYSGLEFPFLGSNYLREPVRQFSLKAYRFYLEFYYLDSLTQILNGNPDLKTLPLKEIQKNLPGELKVEKWNLKEQWNSIPEVLKRYRVLLKELNELVFKSAERDVKRGRAIFDDYDDVHSEDANFMNFVKNYFEEKLEKARILTC